LTDEIVDNKDGNEKKVSDKTAFSVLDDAYREWHPDPKSKYSLLFLNKFWQTDYNEDPKTIDLKPAVGHTQRAPYFRRTFQNPQGVDKLVNFFR